MSGETAPVAAPPGPTTPLRPRWGGHPGVPLTEAPLRPGGAVAYAMYTIVFNLLISIVVAVPSVMAGLRGVLVAIAGATGIPRVTVAIAGSGVLLVVAYALIFLPVPIMAARRGVRLADFVGMRRVNLSAVVAGALGVIGFGTVITIAYGVALQLFRVSPVSNASQIASAFGASPFGLVVAFLAVCVVAPFVEEIAYRGVLFSSLRECWGQPVAIVVAGCLFGMAHLVPLLMIPTALLGMALAWVYTSTRSLWASMAAHACYNAFTLLLAFSALARVR